MLRYHIFVTDSTDDITSSCRNQIINEMFRRSGDEQVVANFKSRDTLPRACIKSISRPTQETVPISCQNVATNIHYVD